MSKHKFTFQVPRNSFFFPTRAVSIGVGSVATRYKNYLTGEFKKLIDTSFENDWKGLDHELSLIKLRAFIKANEIFIKMKEEGLTEKNIRVQFQGADMSDNSVQQLAQGFYYFFLDNSKTLSELAYVVDTNQVDVPEPSAEPSVEPEPVQE